MTNILNQQTIQVNLTIVPKNPVNLQLIQGNDLESKVVEIYGDSSKPVLTKFPDIFVLFDPNHQITVNVLSERNRIIVGDNRVTPYAGRDLQKFIQFSKSVVDMLLKQTKTEKMEAYGLNIMSIFDIDQEDSSKFLLKKFIKQKDNTISFIGGGIRLIFKANGSDVHRNDLRLDPRFGSKLQPTKSIQVNQNSHFKLTSLPPLEQFNTQVTNIYNKLPLTLSKIL